jgi:hypothetical protein
LKVFVESAGRQFPDDTEMAATITRIAPGKASERFVI